MTEVKPGSPQHVGVDTVIQFKMKKGKLTGLKIAPLDDMPNLPSFCEPQVHIGDMPSQLSKDTGRTLDFYAFCQEVEKDKTQDGDPRITFTLRNDSQESAKMVWCTPHDAKYDQLAGCVILVYGAWADRNDQGKLRHLKANNDCHMVKVYDGHGDPPPTLSTSL